MTVCMRKPGGILTDRNPTPTPIDARIGLRPATRELTGNDGGPRNA